MDSITNEVVIGIIVALVSSIATYFLTKKQNDAQTMKLIQDFYSETIKDMNIELTRLKDENEEQGRQIEEFKEKLKNLIEKETLYLQQANTLREEKLLLQKKIDRMEEDRLKTERRKNN